MKKMTAFRGKPFKTAGLILGLAIAAAFTLPVPEALGTGSSLRVWFSIDMVNSGVDPDAVGKVDGTLSHSANANSQQLKLAVSNLTPNTKYQLMAFIGDELNPRTVTDLTTDARGAVLLTYVQKCPITAIQTGVPVPAALDPISHIHQLDIVQGGNVILTAAIGADLPADCAGPSVTSTVPGPNETGVGRNQEISATFSEPMTASTLTRTSFVLKQGAKLISGTISCVGDTAKFKPSSPLLSNALYTATITTRVKDQSGNALPREFVWAFSTGGVVTDNTPPTVSSTVPSNGDTGITPGQTVSATFSEPMDAASINGTTFTLAGPGGTPVSGAVAYDANSRKATLTPASSLQSGSVYTATISKGARDVSANSLANDCVWSFTVAQLPSSVEIINLGYATNVAILAGVGVTSTGNTVINGAVGTYPGSDLTGFPPGEINGELAINGNGSPEAMGMLMAAYADAAGRTEGAVPVGGDVSGQTFNAGLYHATSSLEILSGDVTLDGQGNENAVFIFQIPTTLSAKAGLRVILSNGAQANNVFWQVGDSATLGGACEFAGNIMASQAITMDTGATLNGRALAINGAVTLAANTITKP